MKCKCGSHAINHHLHGRDGSRPDLCDVCYWRAEVSSLTVEREFLRMVAEEAAAFTKKSDHLREKGAESMRERAASLCRGLGLDYAASAIRALPLKEDK